MTQAHYTQKQSSATSHPQILKQELLPLQARHVPPDYLDSYKAVHWHVHAHRTPAVFPFDLTYKRTLH